MMPDSMYGMVWCGECSHVEIAVTIARFSTGQSVSPFLARTRRTTTVLFQSCRRCSLSMNMSSLNPQCPQHRLGLGIIVANVVHRGLIPSAAVSTDARRSADRPGTPKRPGYSERVLTPRHH
jgi:hypothetical protein